MRYLFFICVIRLTARVTPFNADSRSRRTAALFNKLMHPRRYHPMGTPPTSRRGSSETLARKLSMRHQNPIRNFWIEHFIPMIIAIAPSPWLFRVAGIDIAVAPIVPKSVIVACYCIGAVTLVKIVLHRVVRCSTDEQKQQIGEGEQAKK